MRALAYDGIQQSGRALLCSKTKLEKGPAESQGKPFVARLGAGHLPTGVCCSVYLSTSHLLACVLCACSEVVLASH